MTLGERFWDLLGNWSGVEEQSASSWAPAARTRAALTFKLDLAGTAVVQDYRQVRDDGDELLAHGVFLADDSAADGVLWWLFDSVGQAPEPGRGGWSGRTLQLTRTTPRGSAHHRFELATDRLTYAIDVALPGREPAPFLRGPLRARQRALNTPPRSGPDASALLLGRERRSVFTLSSSRRNRGPRYPMLGGVSGWRPGGTGRSSAARRRPG